jgi:membrane protein implicated in regulation of membrane protease activity
LNTPLILAFFVLIGLKLGGVITWSWWAVSAPVWIPLLALLTLGLPLAGLALTSRLGEWLEDRRYQRLDRPPRWIGSGSPDA